MKPSNSYPPSPKTSPKYIEFSRAAKIRTPWCMQSEPIFRNSISRPSAPSMHVLFMKHGTTSAQSKGIPGNKTFLIGCPRRVAPDNFSEVVYFVSSAAIPYLADDQAKSTTATPPPPANPVEGDLKTSSFSYRSRNERHNIFVSALSTLRIVRLLISRSGIDLLSLGPRNERRLNEEGGRDLGGADLSLCRRYCCCCRPYVSSWFYRRFLLAASVANWMLRDFVVSIFKKDDAYSNRSRWENWL